MHELIIIGGGPAGLTAAIYAARRAMKVLVLAKDIGGQMNLAHRIENYPGFLEVTGLDLMQLLEKQAMKTGADIKIDNVIAIKEKGESYLVKTDDKQFETKAIILAYGKSPRSLGVPGEEIYQGKGVSYCATCDMPVFKDKVVAVVGGGNSALDAALHGSDIAKKVYLIHRRDEFRGFEYLLEKVKGKSNVEFMLNSSVTEIRGDKFVKSIKVKNAKTNKQVEIKVDGVFVEIGYEVKADMIKDLVKLDEHNQVVINGDCETFYPKQDKVRPGVFAAGDITNTQFKQIVIAAGEGAKAALQAYHYVHGAEPGVMDWTKEGNK